MYAHPGKKLMFMGAEIGQGGEWDDDHSLDWHLLEVPRHAGIHRFVRELNRTYAAEPALHEIDFDPAGFSWIDCNDSENSVVSFIRRGKDGRSPIVAVLNFTPVQRDGYRIGVPRAGEYRELLNSDAEAFGGCNVGNGGLLFAEPIVAHGQPQSLRLTLPALSCLLLKPSVEWQG
jgi:1,4-alpha-glucan branching enzyme